MANRTFSRLIALVTPSSDNYFVLFNDLATCSVRGAKVLAQMSSVNDPVAFEQHFQKIRKIESEADEITKTILLSLHKTFITPFDRSEIKDLAMALDDMIDYMEDIPQRAELYGPGEFSPETSTLGQIAVRATEKIQEAVAMLEDLKNAEGTLKICQEIGEIEGEARSEE